MGKTPVSKEVLVLIKKVADDAYKLGQKDHANSISGGSSPNSPVLGKDKAVETSVKKYFD